VGCGKLEVGLDRRWEIDEMKEINRWLLNNFVLDLLVKLWFEIRFHYCIPN
jgi:hypothetical protein